MNKLCVVTTQEQDNARNVLWLRPFCEICVGHGLPVGVGIDNTVAHTGSDKVCRSLLSLTALRRDFEFVPPKRDASNWQTIVEGGEYRDIGVAVSE